MLISCAQQQISGLEKKRSFLGMTAQSITKDLKRHSVALACQRFKGTHSYDRITDLIKQIYTEFGLTGAKLVASVTDNGSNFVKAFRTFGVQLTNISTSESNEPADPVSEDTDIESDSSLDEGPQKIFFLPAHLRCCAHTLSLCATVDACDTVIDKF